MKARRTPPRKRAAEESASKHVHPHLRAPRNLLLIKIYCHLPMELELELELKVGLELLTPPSTIKKFMPGALTAF